MTYDAHAQKLAIKVIGTVESSLRYDAINYADPVTVGVAQWYGTRAAAILTRIKTENPSTWVGVAASLDDDLVAHAATESSFWTARYLTRAEGASLKSVLLANQALQNLQLVEDLEEYVTVATRAGIDKDTNTQVLIYFMSMYHQSPRRALNVIGAAGGEASLARVHSICLNEEVLGKYRTRYITTRDLILADDVSGVEDPAQPSPDPEPGGDDGSGASRAPGDVRWAQVHGDAVIIRFKDHTLTCYANGQGYYTPIKDTSTGADVVPTEPNPSPEEPPSSDVVSKRNAVVAWMTSRLDRYAYSQGPLRLTPEKGMYTDCSALVYYAYQQVLGIRIGTYTGAQYTQGQLITKGSGAINLSLLEKGDLIFFNWAGGRSTVDHVEMYAGDGKCVGHGGPDPGPDIGNLNDKATGAINWYVRRHIV